jgi:ankyrin repeat protein
MKNLFCYAAEKGYLDIVKYFIQNGANPHFRDDYAIEWSGLNGHIEVVNYLKTL